MCVSDDRLVHLGRWVGLSSEGLSGCALAGLKGCGYGDQLTSYPSPSVALSSVLLAALRLFDALTDLVTYRCTKGFPI